MANLDPRLQSAIEGIVALVRPEAVLLFGSRARDDSDDASDWDLFVVLPDDAPPGIARPSALRRAAAPAHRPFTAARPTAAITSPRIAAARWSAI